MSVVDENGILHPAILGTIGTGLAVTLAATEGSAGIALATSGVAAVSGGIATGIAGAGALVATAGTFLAGAAATTVATLGGGGIAAIIVGGLLAGIKAGDLLGRAWRGSFGGWDEVYLPDPLGYYSTEIGVSYVDLLIAEYGIAIGCTKDCQCNTHLMALEPTKPEGVEAPIDENYALTSKGLKEMKKEALASYSCKRKEFKSVKFWKNTPYDCRVRVDFGTGPQS